MASQKEGEHWDMLGIFKLIIVYDHKNAAYESCQLKSILGHLAYGHWSEASSVTFSSHRSSIVFILIAANMFHGLDRPYYYVVMYIVIFFKFNKNVRATTQTNYN